ncbi:beta-galactosidase [Hollandina sp. SP2]
MNDKNAALFNADWKFLLGDPENAFQEQYPDRTWKRVDLPHDWVISQPFKRGEEQAYTPQNMQGFFAWEGTAWYRKTFFLSDTDIDGKITYIYFGGAYRNSAVYVNGKKAGGRAYGYASFELNITGLVKPGKNCIAVRLDNGCEAPDRWYSGSGLYRNVYLRIVPAVHIKTWGVLIKTETARSSGRISSAAVTLTVSLVNLGGPAKGRVGVQIQGQDNQRAAEFSEPFNAAGGGEYAVQLRRVIQKPLLWSAEEPNLYRAIVHLEDDEGNALGKPVEVPFGIRVIEIMARTGMQVNDKPVKLKGVCLHHDCGITGSAFYEAAWRRRLLALKSIGCNGIRTSHNPPAEELLDLCDELGFYVIDECFDKWKSGYYGARFDDDWQRDLGDFLLRDRNHPSVFMWSAGNEVENQGSGDMRNILKTLVSFVRTLDDRPVTCALQPHVHPPALIGAPISRLVEITQTLAEDVDVLGLNYHEALYQDYSAGIPKPIVGTECYEYYSSTASNYEDVTAKNPWRFVVENDNVIGQFIWAGIEYLGESAWPAKGWAGAILDICGFLKPNAFYRKSIWSEEPVVFLAFYDTSRKPDYVRGRWSFPKLAAHLNLDHFNRETVKAAVFTNCDEVEVWINGKKLGRRSPGDFENRIIEWTFEYAPGEVKTLGYRKGKEVCSHILKTAGPPRRILLHPDKDVLAAGDMVHVEVAITDETGILCPNEEGLVEFALTGDGIILGSCSPDISGSWGYALPKTITSGGKALVIIRAGAGTGTLKLSAYSGTLIPAFLELAVI